MYSLFQHEKREKAVKTLHDQLKQTSPQRKRDRLKKIYGKGPDEMAERSRSRRERTFESHNSDNVVSLASLPVFREEDRSKHLAQPNLFTNIDNLPRAAFLGGGFNVPDKSKQLASNRETIMKNRMDIRPTSLEQPPYHTVQPHSFRDRSKDEELNGEFYVPIKANMRDFISRPVSHQSPAEHAWPFLSRYASKRSDEFRMLAGRDFRVSSRSNLSQPSTEELALFRESFHGGANGRNIFIRRRNKDRELDGDFRTTFPSRLVGDTSRRPVTAPSGNTNRRVVQAKEEKRTTRKMIIKK